VQTVTDAKGLHAAWRRLHAVNYWSMHPIWACMLLREMGFRCFVKRHAQQRSRVAMKVPTSNAAMLDLLIALRSLLCHISDCL
jgi:type III secretory pathway component EscT